MYKHILVATDGSEYAERAFSHAVELAKMLGAKLTAVTVTAPLEMTAIEGVVISPPADDYDAWQKQQATIALDKASGAAAAAGVTAETRHLVRKQAYEGIIEAARSEGCDLIVMASHGRRGVSALLLGSETQKVLTHSTVPVLVVR
ncbi:MAG: universal stress protein [Burkholderiaceae bacterium]